MRDGSRFPNDAAKVTFREIFLEQLEELPKAQAISVLAEIVNLCGSPAGKHPLSGPLAGWNTLDVLGGHQRGVYKATITSGVGLVEVLCLGPRVRSEVYDMAVALIPLLDADEATQLWEALALLDVVAEKPVWMDGTIDHLPLQKD